MALTPGTRLGVYDITGQIGEGGMGQVYRARDLKLDRDVAIKILPEAFAHDADRLARFRREAKMLASLNNPHIAAIYALEETGGVSALVMELVEGEDLSQRISRGAIPLDEALPIAKQIVDALEVAHELGIIHRDLKPANIKVRPDGTVKMLDFGLAKAMDPTAASSSNVSMAPTLTSPAMMTGVGMILGTAAYMAPEQARGKTVDKRADIWAFGAVLFEMLTGRRAFPGEDVTDTIVAVVSKEPDWSALPASTTGRLRRLLARCLKKEPKIRLQAIGEARVQIDELISGVPDAFDSPGFPNPQAATRTTRPWATLAGLLGVAFITALTLRAPWRAQTTADRSLVRLDVDLGPDVSLPAPLAAGSSIAIAPDGTRLVYLSGTPTKLFIRRLDQSKAMELPGTQGATVPFFSPDGHWVGFLAAARASKISVEGGAVVAVGNGTNITGARWGDDGSVFVSAFQKIFRIPPVGGAPETVAEPRPGELSLVDPQVLPGGKALLFAADNPGPVDKTTIEVVTLADRQRKTLIHGGASPRFVATSNGAGHLLYVNQATLFAIPLDLNTLTTYGTAVPLLDDVAHENLVGVGQFDVSRTGTLIYRRASFSGSVLTTVQWVDAAGKKTPLLTKPGAIQDLSLSPDGKRAALTVKEGGNQDVWVFDPQRDTMTRVTFGGTTYRTPRWSPDGRYLVFASVGNGLFQTRADGASQPEALTQSRAYQVPWSFTSDGKRLAYYEDPGGGQIWTVPLEDQGGRLRAGMPERFLKSSVNDVTPSFSPDGRWLAYQSNESGTNEVYVRAFPPPGSGQGGKWQVSSNGGASPRWSRRSHELVYEWGDQLMAASYTVTGDTFVAEKPRVWIAKLGVAQVANGVAWDLAADGTRVAVVTPIESAEAPTREHEVVFLLNFFDELRRRVPAEK